MNIESTKRLMQKGYSKEDVARAVRDNLPELDFHAKGEGFHYDKAGNYKPPAQVIAELLSSPMIKSPDDLKEIELALLEFNLFWKERPEGRAIYPHYRFIQFIKGRNYRSTMP